MRTRPKIFVFLSTTFILVGLSVPVQAYLLYGHGLGESAAALHKLTILNWAVALSCVACGLLAWNASPGIKLAAPVSLVAVLWNNWVVASVGHDFSRTEVVLGLVLFAALHALWFLKPSLLVLKDPAKRWWITPRRKRIAATTLVQTWLGESFTTQTFDISRNGVFLELGSNDTRDSVPMRVLKNLQSGRHLTLKIMLSPFRTIRCDAEVVRVCSATSSHPAGVGLKFVSFYGLARQEIRKLLLS
jgi:hypothetical protein